MGGWRIYKCARGHMVALREAGPCPKCGSPTFELGASQRPEEPRGPDWVELRRGEGVFEAKGLRFKVYGAKAEVRETGRGVAIERLD